MAVLSAAALWLAPAGSWHPHTASAGKSITEGIFSASYSFFSSPLSLGSLLQVWQWPIQVRCACRGFRAGFHAGAGGGSQEVQGSERRPRSGFVEATQHQRSLSELWAQHQCRMPSSGRHRGKYSVVMCCHSNCWLDRSGYVSADNLAHTFIHISSIEMLN